MEYTSQLKVLKETNEKSINIDPYCCKIAISRLHKIEPVTTVGHIPREISRYVLSSHRRCSIKKVFLKISQNSHEETSARVFLTGDSGTGVFL